MYFRSVSFASVMRSLKTVGGLDSVTWFVSDYGSQQELLFVRYRLSRDVCGGDAPFPMHLSLRLHVGYDTINQSIELDSRCDPPDVLTLHGARTPGGTSEQWRARSKKSDPYDGAMTVSCEPIRSGDDRREVCLMAMTIQTGILFLKLRSILKSGDHVPTHSRRGACSADVGTGGHDAFLSGCFSGEGCNTSVHGVTERTV